MRQGAFLWAGKAKILLYVPGGKKIFTSFQKKCYKLNRGIIYAHKSAHIGN